jgi:hypothetical protein
MEAPRPLSTGSITNSRRSGVALRTAISVPIHSSKRENVLMTGNIAIRENLEYR